MTISLSRRIPLAAFVGVLALVASLAAQTPARPAAARPRLVLLLVMDQFRADYVTLYRHQWTKGLKRLLDAGAVFTNAAYPYAATFTCAGHATIGTGALPHVHGMAGNTFFDRSTSRTVPCAYDAQATSVPFGGATGRERHSYRSIKVPTFAESLREQSPGSPQVVSLALKPRSAIGMAGRNGPGVTVIWEEDDGTWATSDAYATTPWPDVDAYVRAHPIADAYGDVWAPFLAPAAYRFDDDAPGEGRPAPWGRTFPHPLESPSGEPDLQFVTAWERSPWSDAYLTDLALHLLGTRKLGTTTRTDMLAVSLAALDLVGHEFGPRSHEVQDVLARADAHFGRLLDAVDRQVGRGRYVVAFTSDHGVATIPEQIAGANGDAGRVSTTELRNAANGAIARALGGPPTNAVAAIFDHQIALGAGVMDKLRAIPGAVDAVKVAIANVRGMASAYSVDDILNGKDTSDPFLQQWRLSFVADRGGDFAYVTRSQWMGRSASGTTHGSPHAYDRHVPLILYGAGIRAGSHGQAASPADVAPTLASLTGVRLPNAQGRVLVEALQRR